MDNACIAQALGVAGLGCEDALVHLLNFVWPNIFEQSPHVINAVTEAIEGCRVALGPTRILQYCLQGLFPPARKVREAYWKIYNNVYGAPQQSHTNRRPRLPAPRHVQGALVRRVGLTWPRARLVLVLRLQSATKTRSSRPTPTSPTSTTTRTSCSTATAATSSSARSDGGGGGGGGWSEGQWAGGDSARIVPLRTKNLCRDDIL